MDYKELIRILRDEDRGDVLDWVDDAADAIETLMEERDAAVEYIPRNCQTCKWWDIDKGCTAPDDMGQCLDLREAWQWRGPQKEGGGDG